MEGGFMLRLLLIIAVIGTFSTVATRPVQKRDRAHCRTVLRARTEVGLRRGEAITRGEKRHTRYWTKWQRMPRATTSAVHYPYSSTTPPFGNSA